MDALLDKMNPQRAVMVDQITAAQHFYFATRELSRGIRKRLERMHDRARERKAPVEFARGRKAVVSRAASLRTPRIFALPAELSLRELLFSADLGEQLRALTTVREENAPEHSHRRDFAALLNELSLYQYLLSCAANGPTRKRVLLILRSLRDGATTELDWLAKQYTELFGERLGMKVSQDVRPEANVALLSIEAVAAEIARYEAGMHVFSSTGPGLAPVAVKVDTLKDGVQPVDVWRDIEGPSEPSGLVLRLYNPSAIALDFRTGLACSGPPEAGDLRRFLTALLPRPDEWEA
jgi:hypothetical protein